MKKQMTIKNSLPVLITLIIYLTGVNAYAQATIPDFTLLNSCVISQSTGYHDGNGWVDIDNDGDLDLIITNSCGNNKPNLLYRNERTDLFTQIKGTEYTTQSVNFALSGPFGDIDNDGDEDLILVDWQGTKNRIYRNDGYGNFSAAGIIDKSKGAMSVLMDINNDSFLDLIELNSNESKIFPNGGQGNFSDYQAIEITPPNSVSTLFIRSFGDADGDGDLDLYLGYMWSSNENPNEQNQFYLNDGSGNYIKEPDTSILVAEKAPTIAANWVDYDNDGDLDLYVLESSYYGPATDFTGVLYENKGGLVFEKIIIEPLEYCNTHKTSSVWGDLNNDGYLDLLISVEKTTYYGHTTDLKHNILFKNNGDGSFTEIKECTLVDESSHTATMEDFDNDGDLDVITAGLSWATNGSNFLYENQGNDNSWFVLTCEGTHSGKTPYGVRVQAHTAINGKSVVLTREITPTTGHNTTYPSSRLHFGLGDADMVDTLIIRWPSGHIDAYLGVEANRFYRAVEDSVLETDYKATNYIRLNPYLADTAMYEGENLTFNLEEYYELVTGDVVPEDINETLAFSLYKNENTDAVNASIEGNILTLTPGTTTGISTVQVLVSAGFTERVDGFIAEYKIPSAIQVVSAPQYMIYPNPVRDILNIECSAPEENSTTLEIMDISGKVVYEDNYFSGRSTHTLNLELFEAGIYIIRIGNADYNYVQKVIKQ